MVGESAPRRRARADLSDRRLLWLVALAALLLAGYFALFSALPYSFQKPGYPPLYIIGAVGAALLLVSMVFVLVKRTGRGGPPPTWMMAHVVAGLLGGVLVAVHSAGRLRQPPALLFLALLGLVALGVWARVRLSRRMAATFATKPGSFAAPPREARARLAEIIAAKQRLLARLDAAASEAVFSPTLAHWLSRPVLCWAYMRLVREESRLIGTRRAVGFVQAHWRQAHLALGYLFVAGLLAHVITVTFFAGYVAGDAPITWWYITDW